MPTDAPAPWRRWLRIGWIVMLLALASCAQLPLEAAIAIPPIPRGEARVWFYRDVQPSVSSTRPYIRMNGRIVGVSEPGGTFYRDVPPGRYHVSVDSYLPDVGLTRDIDLAPGQQAYFKVLPVQVACGQEGTESVETNFYVWTMPAAVAQAAVARSQFYAGGG
jgi:hypothetical protein